MVEQRANSLSSGWEVLRGGRGGWRRGALGRRFRHAPAGRVRPGLDGEQNRRILPSPSAECFGSRVEPLLLIMCPGPGWSWPSVVSSFGVVVVKEAPERDTGYKTGRPQRCDARWQRAAWLAPGVFLGCSGWALGNLFLDVIVWPAAVLPVFLVPEVALKRLLGECGEAGIFPILKCPDDAVQQDLCAKSRGNSTAASNEQTDKHRRS